MATKLKLDPKEAPDGFYAVLKSDFTNPTGDYPNLCDSCDWRKQCCDPETDLTIPKHRCMSTPLNVIKTGAVVQRLDGCSVVFKKLAETPPTLK